MCEFYNPVPGEFLDNSTAPEDAENFPFVDNTNAIDGWTVQADTFNGRPRLRISRNGVVQRFTEGSQQYDALTAEQGAFHWVILKQTDDLRAADPTLEIRFIVAWLQTSAGSSTTYRPTIFDLQELRRMPASLFQATEGAPTSHNFVFQYAPDGTAYYGHVGGLGTQNKTDQHRVFRCETATQLCSYGVRTEAVDRRCRFEGRKVIIFGWDNDPWSECELPVGQLSAAPASINLGEIAYGAECSNEFVTAQVVLTNTGRECLELDELTLGAPFTITAAGPDGALTLPLAGPISLEPGEAVTVTIRFEPTNGTAQQFSDQLVARYTTAAGDATLSVQVTASVRGATQRVTVSTSSIGFGRVPAGTTTSQDIQICNRGDSPVRVHEVSSPDPGSVFAWRSDPGAPFTLDCQGCKTLTLDFSSTSATDYSFEILIRSDAPESPQRISVSGRGCIGQGELGEVPQFPGFGNVQRGFRTVRRIRVSNVGGGPLTVNAHLENDPGELFSLRKRIDEPLTESRLTSFDYIILPIAGNACGAESGDGFIDLPVSFHARGLPREVGAQLRISAAGAEPVTRVITATITQPASIDAALAIDRSHSMDGAKLDAAKKAGELFVKLARPADADNSVTFDDRLAVIEFHEVAGVVQAMVPVISGDESQDNPPTQANIAKRIRELGGAENTPTSIAAGIIAADMELNAPRGSTPAGLRKAICIITDGIDNRAFVQETSPAVSGIFPFGLFGFGRAPVKATYAYFSLVGGWAKGVPFEGDQSATIRWEELFPTPPTDDATGRPFWAWYWTERVPIGAGVTLSAVGVGSDANVDLGHLSQRCAESNGGTFNLAETSGPEGFFQLQKFLTAVWMQDLLNQSIIADPLATALPGDGFKYEFWLEASYVRLTAVIYDKDGRRLPFFLITPKGDRIHAMSVPPAYSVRSGETSTARFIEVLLPEEESDQASGRWTLVVEHPGAYSVGKDPKPYNKPIEFAYLIGGESQYRMDVWLTPDVVRKGETITAHARLTEYDLPVTGCEMMVTVTDPHGTQSGPFKLNDDGASDDGARDDGHYAGPFVTDAKQVGFYRFYFRALRRTPSGRIEVREATVSKYVEDPSNPTAPDTRRGNGTVLLIDETKKGFRQLRTAIYVAGGLVSLAIMLAWWWLNR